MNPPSALASAMARDRKPFTYTPGGLDLSEIKSERMAQRLMRNAMNQGVPEKPLQVTSPPTTTPIAVPNYNCMPVQVFPMNLPANPKSLLRTRSVPGQPREPLPSPSPRVYPQYVNNTLPRAAPQYDTFSTNTPAYQQINNNRPASLYDNAPTAPSYMNYGSGGQTTAFPETSYDSLYNAANVPPYVQPSVPSINTNVPSFEPAFKSVNFNSYLSNNGENVYVPKISTPVFGVDVDNVTNEVTEAPVAPEVVTIPIVEDQALDEQKEVKVVSKQVKKETNVEEQNGGQNGEGDTETQAVVKLPAKKSAAKTETKVEVTKKTLPDGSIEEVTKTITKTTVDGKTEIRTKTETRTIPKGGDEEEEEYEEEEEQEAEVVTEEPKENGHSSITKTQESSETVTISKRAVVVQENTEEPEQEVEEVVEEDAEVEEVEPVTIVLKKPVTPTTEDKEEVVEEIEEAEEQLPEEEIAEEEVKEEIKLVQEEVKQEENVVEEDVKDEVKEETQEAEATEEEVAEEVVEESNTAKVENEEKPQEPEQPEETQEVEVEREEVQEEVEQEEEKPSEVKETTTSEVVEDTKEEVNEQEVVESKQEIVVEKEEVKEEKPEVKEIIITPKVELKPPEPQVPLREPSVPLEKVEDVEIKPIGAGDFVKKTHIETTQIITTSDKPVEIAPGTLSTSTEYNRTENIVTVNRTIKTLDNTFEQTIPPVKSFFTPHVEKIASPQNTRPYQPVYPPEPTTERRHSLLLDRLSVDRQMPSDLYQNSYQYSNQATEQQRQWSQEPQAEVLTVSNVKPSMIANQQWYQQTNKKEVYNQSAPWQQQTQPQAQIRQPSPQPQPTYQAQFEPQVQPQPQYQPQYQPPAQPQYQPPAQPQYEPPAQPQYQQQRYVDTQQSNTQQMYSSYTAQPTTWSNNQLETSSQTQSNQYSFKEPSPSYQPSYSSSYVPPPWEQDSTYAVDTSQNYFQPPPPSTTTPTPAQGWTPTPPAAKFSKTTPTAYIPPKPNQSFVKPVINVDPPKTPGRKTYYSEYERRYISVPESTYIPAETKYQPQPDPSPQYYYDNNEPAETVEHEWRKELREFTEKTQTQTETNVKPPWEVNSKYVNPDVNQPATPTWSQTLRPRSWRERSFESDYVSQTNTLGRGRPLSSIGKEVIPERVRGVSVDRYNPNSYQAPLAGEHPPVQTYTHNPPAPHATGYHNPNVPAYHARASAEPREQPIPQARYRDLRASPFQSRSFKYLQWITGTDD